MKLVKKRKKQRRPPVQTKKKKKKPKPKQKIVATKKPKPKMIPKKSTKKKTKKKRKREQTTTTEIDEDEVDETQPPTKRRKKKKKIKSQPKLESHPEPEPEPESEPEDGMIVDDNDDGEIEEEEDKIEYISEENGDEEDYYEEVDGDDDKMEIDTAPVPAPAPAPKKITKKPNPKFLGFLKNRRRQTQTLHMFRDYSKSEKDTKKPKEFRDPTLQQRYDSYKKRTAFKQDHSLRHLVVFITQRKFTSELEEKYTKKSGKKYEKYSERYHYTCEVIDVTYAIKYIKKANKKRIIVEDLFDDGKDVDMSGNKQIFLPAVTTQPFEWLTKTKEEEQQQKKQSVPAFVIKTGTMIKFSTGLNPSYPSAGFVAVVNDLVYKENTKSKEDIKPMIMMAGSVENLLDTNIIKEELIVDYIHRIYMDLWSKRNEVVFHPIDPSDFEEKEEKEEKKKFVPKPPLIIPCTGMIEKFEVEVSQHLNYVVPNMCITTNPQKEIRSMFGFNVETYEARDENLDQWRKVLLKGAAWPPKLDYFGVKNKDAFNTLMMNVAKAGPRCVTELTPPMIIIADIKKQGSDVWDKDFFVKTDDPYGIYEISYTLQLWVYGVIPDMRYFIQEHVGIPTPVEEAMLIVLRWIKNRTFSWEAPRAKQIEDNKKVEIAMKVVDEELKKLNDPNSESLVVTHSVTKHGVNCMNQPFTGYDDMKPGQMCLLNEYSGNLVEFFQKVINGEGYFYTWAAASDKTTEDLLIGLKSGEVNETSRIHSVDELKRDSMKRWILGCSPREDKLDSDSWVVLLYFVAK
jgi:hypothetical protein